MQFEAEARFIEPGDLTRGVRRPSRLGPPELVTGTNERDDHVEVSWLILGGTESGTTKVLKRTKVVIER